MGGVFGWNNFGGEKMVGQIVFSLGPRLFNTPPPLLTQKNWKENGKEKMLNENYSSTHSPPQN